MSTTPIDTAPIPLSWVGPLSFVGPALAGQIQVPLATFETPLWPSVNRGARVTAQAGGIRTELLQDTMTRSLVVQGADVTTVAAVARDLNSRTPEVVQIITGTSSFAKLESLTPQVIGNLLYLRLSIHSGDASGHNMVTKAADALMEWLLAQYPQLTYGSLSANLCTDKKTSAANGLLGRGKYVVADCLIPRKLCQRYLHVTPEALVALHIKKNLMGSLAAGSVRSANAHFANMLLAFYLATGQDAANIVEGSQGFVHTEVQNGDLYFSVTCPNLIMGTVGNGKHLGFVKHNLVELGCANPDAAPGDNAKRLAMIMAGVVLCGELSLLGALTNPGELMKSHMALERPSTQKITEDTPA